MSAPGSPKSAPGSPKKSVPGSPAGSQKLGSPRAAPGSPKGSPRAVPGSPKGGPGSPKPGSPRASGNSPNKTSIPSANGSPKTSGVHMATGSGAGSPKASLVKDSNDPDIDTELEELENEIAFMEKETQQVRDMTETLDTAAEGEGLQDSDKRSCYVGNVDYGSTPEELQAHFKACGPISRITIMVDKYTCSPKGFAYIEFESEESVKSAVLLNDSLFRGRQLKVVAKRTNVPGYYSQMKGADKGWKGAKKGAGKKGKGKIPYYAPVWGYAPKGKGKGKWASPY